MSTLQSAIQHTSLCFAGGRSMVERMSELKRFKATRGPRVLIATDVADFGINFQPMVVINFDLPEHEKQSFASFGASSWMLEVAGVFSTIDDEATLSSSLCTLFSSSMLLSFPSFGASSLMLEVVGIDDIDGVLPTAADELSVS